MTDSNMPYADSGVVPDAADDPLGALYAAAGQIRGLAQACKDAGIPAPTIAVTIARGVGIPEDTLRNPTFRILLSRVTF